MYSFTRRKQQLEVQRQIRRIIDRLTQKRPGTELDQRGESRSNFTLPVLLFADSHSPLSLDSATAALTRDFSGNGVSVTINQDWPSEQVIVVFCSEGNLKCLRAIVHGSRAFGGGYWQLGLELVDLLTTGELLTPGEALRMTEFLTPASA